MITDRQAEIDTFVERAERRIEQRSDALIERMTESQHQQQIALIRMMGGHQPLRTELTVARLQFIHGIKKCWRQWEGL
jgi:hypothetical protein